MRVVYSDESGVGSEKEEPITVVTALMFDMDTQWNPVFLDMDIASRSSPYRRKLLKNHSEISGRLLFKGVRSNRPDAKEMLAELLEIPNRHHVPIFYGAVNRSEFKKEKGGAVRLTKLEAEKTPHDAAFDLCLESVDHYVHTLLPREQILWISDKTGRENRLKGGLAWFQSRHAAEMLHSKMRLSSHMAHIVDTIYFGHSHESLALQLADVCCSTIKLYLMKRPEATQFYQLIHKQIFVKCS